jgi:hypothetical protein
MEYCNNGFQSEHSTLQHSITPMHLCKISLLLCIGLLSVLELFRGGCSGDVYG